MFYKATILSATVTYGVSASGEIRITGLPLPAVSSNDGGMMLDNNTPLTYPAGITDVRAVTASGQNYLRLSGLRSGNVALAFTTTNLVSGSTFNLTLIGNYKVA
jgi:hypothetical protein